VESETGAELSRFGAHGGTIALRSLEAMVDAGRLPHALLISGPEGIGKHELGLSIAQAVVCEAAPAPCRRCRPCRRIHDRSRPHEPIRHADVALVQPGGICAAAEHDHSNSRTIGICQIRWVERTASLKPFEGPNRVVIVDPADALTAEAADAFLKTLEEPPPGVYFVLLSAPFIPRLRQSRPVRDFLGGVHAVVVAAILVTLLDLARSALTDAAGELWLPGALLCGLALLALLRLRVNATWLILGGGVAGLLLTGAAG